MLISITFWMFQLSKFSVSSLTNLTHWQQTRQGHSDVTSTWNTSVDINHTVMENAYSKTVGEVVAFLGTNEEEGLSDDQVSRNQAKYGPNGTCIQLTNLYLIVRNRIYLHNIWLNWRENICLNLPCRTDRYAVKAWSMLQFECAAYLISSYHHTVSRRTFPCTDTVVLQDSAMFSWLCKPVSRRPSGVWPAGLWPTGCSYNLHV